MPRSSQIEQLLRADDSLQPLLARTREILRLNRQCNEFLPPELATRVRVSNLRDGRLVLLAAHAAAAAKLRLLTPALSDFLIQQGAKVNSVSVRVQPSAVGEPGRATGVARRLSPGGVAALSALYQALGDSPARSALGALLERERQARDRR